jgi:16S rRNA (guanine527-N7)-methyltransferase
VFHVEQTSDLRSYLVDGSAELGLSLTEHQLGQFSQYLRELTIWNGKTNLTAITDTKQIAVKHFLDSLACSKALRSLKSHDLLLDVGAGAGFPGLPLKILCPEIHLTLLEPNQKKTAFLRHIIGTLSLKDSRVLSQPLEEFSTQINYHCTFAYVTTRALNVRSMIHCVEPLLTNHGRLILCRSKSFGSALTLDGLMVTQEIAYDLPYHAGKRVLTILETVPRGTVAMKLTA